MGTQKQPYSKSAIAGLAFGLLFLTGAGLLGLIFGSIGLWVTLGKARRGLGMAVCGLMLGLVSLWLNLTGLPGVFFPPPVDRRDFAFRQFLDDLATPGQTPVGRMVRVDNAPDTSTAQYVRWKEAFNRQAGRGHLLWLAGKTVFGDSQRGYIVYFENAGVHQVASFWDDEAPGCVVCFHDPFPFPGDMIFSDEYNSDPEVRRALDEYRRQRSLAR